MKTLEDAKLVLDVRNTTSYLQKKTQKCKTWKELCILLISELSTDHRPSIALTKAAPALLEALERMKERCDSGGTINKETTGLYNCLSQAIAGAKGSENAT